MRGRSAPRKQSPQRSHDLAGRVALGHEVSIQPRELALVRDDGPTGQPASDRLAEQGIEVDLPQHGADRRAGDVGGNAGSSQLEAGPLWSPMPGQDLDARQGGGSSTVVEDARFTETRDRLVDGARRMSPPRETLAELDLRQIAARKERDGVPVRATAQIA